MGTFVYLGLFGVNVRCENKYVIDSKSKYNTKNVISDIIKYQSITIPIQKNEFRNSKPLTQ